MKSQVSGHASALGEGPLRRRVLVLASTYPRWRGDAEPGFVHELCKRLAVTFDVTVVVPHARGAAGREVMDGVDVRRFRYAPEVVETLVNDGGIVANLKRDRWKWLLLPGFFLASLLATIQALRATSAEVVHAHWLVPQGLVAALAGVLPGPGVPPILVTSHGADLFGLRGAFFARLKRFVISRAAMVSVVSQSMVPPMMALSGRSPRVRSMGVDLASQFVPSDEVVRSRNELLFVGRLVEKKGLRHLIEAMPRILRERPDTVLTVAGFGPEESRLKQQVEALGLQGCVTFAGAVTQQALPGMYQRAALMVAPFVKAADGDEEGLGLVAVEALGCGCPIVVGDVAAAGAVKAAAPELVEISSVQPDALASAVLRQMGVQSTAFSRDQLQARFGWDGVAATYADWLTEVARSAAAERAQAT